MNEATISQGISRTEEDEALAYRPTKAAKLLDVSYKTIRRQILGGKLHQTSFGVIPHKELLRFLDKEMQVARGKASAPMCQVQSHATVSTPARKRFPAVNNVVSLVQEPETESASRTG